MTSLLDEMYNSFLNNTVPKLWIKVSYPSLKPLSPWFDDFLQRV